MLLIRNGRVLRGKHWTRANIIISDSGKIVDIFRSVNAKGYLLSKVDTIYNARGYLIFPGIIDMHVHFREPGLEWKEDFESGSKAAIAGGVTIVADMPNNKPPINSLERYLRKIKLAEKKSYCDFLLYIGLPEDPSQLLKFLEEKDNIPMPAGVKVFMYNPKEENTVLNKDLPKDFLYVFHAEDYRYFTEISDCNDYSAFEKSRPKEAEISAIQKIVGILEKRDLRVHVAHLSSYEGLLEIVRAKKKRFKISTEVTPHHLLLTKDHGRKLGGIAKCYPPLRSELDRRMLFRGLLQGYIDAIASDHAPHSLEEKMKDLCDAEPGITGVQLLLPLIFTLAKKAHVKNFRPIIRALSENPARILGLKKRGRIKIGYYGDLVIFNHRKEWKISPEVLLSKSRVTPYEGMKVKGWVLATFLRGRLVYENGEFLERIGICARSVQ
ncbi:MAG: dihydroorotase [Candidatus Njordarchaeales archaeon]